MNIKSSLLEKRGAKDQVSPPLRWDLLVDIPLKKIKNASIND